jgi:hypothetical protein
MFQRTGSFKKNKINLAEKASKAMYDILIQLLSAILQQTLPKVQYRWHKEW